MIFITAVPKKIQPNRKATPPIGVIIANVLMLVTE